MIEIEARGSFALGDLVKVWEQMDIIRSGLRIGIRDLLAQLSRSKSARLLDPNEFAAVCRQEYLVTALALDHSDLVNIKVVGMAMLFIHRKFSANIGHVENVVVDENHQRQGIGERLMERLLAIAKQMNLKHVSLSSGNDKDRIGGHKLYLKLGFEKRDSTLFRKKLL